MSETETVMPVSTPIVGTVGTVDTATAQLNDLSVQSVPSPTSPVTEVWAYIALLEDRLKAVEAKVATEASAVYDEVSADAVQTKDDLLAAFKHPIGATEGTSATDAAKAAKAA